MRAIGLSVLLIVKSTSSYRLVALICRTSFNIRSCTNFPKCIRWLVTAVAKMHRSCLQLRTDYKINSCVCPSGASVFPATLHCAFIANYHWTDSSARYGRFDGPERGDLISTSSPRRFVRTNYRAVYLFVSSYLVRPLDACSFVHCGLRRRYGKIHGPYPRREIANAGMRAVIIIGMEMPQLTTNLHLLSIKRCMPILDQ